MNHVFDVVGHSPVALLNPRGGEAGPRAIPDRQADARLHLHLHM
jgi:hypothetical protein